MKKLVNLAASLIAGATLMMSASAAMAHADVGARSGARPAYKHGQPHRVAPRDHGHYSRYERHHYRRSLPVRARHYRDRDGDGVSNRHDRAPGNPYRY